MNKVVIIEDEPAAVNELKVLIGQEEDFELMGNTGTLDDALHLIDHIQPDLIFMDISLYDCNAFDILNGLQTMPKHIIFVTAYNQYAIRAIKYGALDYLLKPVDEQEFKEAIERFRNLNERASREQLSLAESTLQKKQAPQHIALPSLGEVRIIPLTDIRYCRGDGPYTHFFLANGKKETVSRPLKFYESMLPEDQFLRTHQSYIVNTAYIESLISHTTVVLDNGEEIPISSRRKRDILNRLIGK
ncbi:LytR/AlgR family response regulator transcription factor [Parapedobacter pyrenivorans]|uniref:LytR/AlgR family response regulator transcription factor n=1 Tax=Parapedobacter pyrenivorans TaxID=1305674 RepID=UPI0033423156